MLCRYRNTIAVYYNVKKHKYTFCLQNTVNFNVEIDKACGKHCTVPVGRKVPRPTLRWKDQYTLLQDEKIHKPT